MATRRYLHPVDLSIHVTSTSIVEADTQQDPGIDGGKEADEDWLTISACLRLNILFQTRRVGVVNGMPLRKTVRNTSIPDTLGLVQSACLIILGSHQVPFQAAKLTKLSNSFQNLGSNCIDTSTW